MARRIAPKLELVDNDDFPQKKTRAPRKTKAEKFDDERNKKPPLVAQTPKQQEYLDALRMSDQVICLGPPGTGKTYMASVFAADLLRQNKVGKIILTRPNVPATKSLGMLPGTMMEKFLPWLAPITETMKDRMGVGAFDCAMKSGSIEAIPLEYMRGRSFNGLVIVDEAQNLTDTEAKLILTRMSVGSKLILNGDVGQCDLKEKSGLATIVHLAKKYMLPLSVVEFSFEDIQRGDMTAAWIKAFYKEGL